MSKPVVYAITFVVCIFLQIAVAPAIAIAGCEPNFLLIPVLLVALRSGMGAGGVSGFLLGLFYDLMNNGTVGCMALVFTIAALIAGLVGASVETSSPLSACLVVLVSAVFVELAYGIAVALTNAEAAGVASTLVTNSLPSALYSAFFGCIALVTIGLVMADEAPAMSGRLAGGFGSGTSKMPRMHSRLK